ncbi:hypothetical protein ACEOCU_24230 [Escherichia coli]|uniref:hypothetical protein n=1 Tax=Escherichia coli TaxID=562 RepID=UPI003570CBC0|nr:hypothetical protein [Escherichia coli]
MGRISLLALVARQLQQGMQGMAVMGETLPLPRWVSLLAVVRGESLLVILLAEFRELHLLGQYSQWLVREDREDQV